MAGFLPGTAYACDHCDHCLDLLHAGTLKLLYEEIISRLRKEGKKELAFGFAPFFNVRDHRFKRYIHWMRWTALYLFHCANNV